MMHGASAGRNRRIRAIVLLMLFGFFLYRIDLFWGLILRFISIISAFIVGGIMAMVINLPMRFLERHLRFGNSKLLSRLRRVIALSLSTLFVLAIVALLLVVVIPEVLGAIERLINRIPGLLRQVETWLSTYNTNILALFGASETDASSVRDLFQRGRDFLLGGINYSGAMMVSAAQMILNGIIGLVFALYLLYSKERIMGQLRQVVLAYAPKRHSQRLLDIIQLFITTYSSFIAGQCVQSLVSTVLVWVVMVVFGFPYAVLVALLTFICAFIPIFGPFISGILGTLLVYTAAPGQALWFLAIFFVVQQLEGSLVYPRILSSAIDIPSIWVLVAATLGGGIMGIAGMLLFIPLVAVIYRLLAEDSLQRVTADAGEASLG